MTDRFELLEELGTGGMGSVWKARDSETGEVVALKLMHPHLARDARAVERFEREVEIARRIDSPYVVKVLGVGLTFAALSVGGLVLALYLLVMLFAVNAHGRPPWTPSHD